MKEGREKEREKGREKGRGKGEVEGVQRQEVKGTGSMICNFAR